MSFEDAKNCFARNLDLFSNPDRHPEKYHLYLGLVALCEAMESIQAENRKLKMQVVSLQKKGAKRGRDE